MTNVSNLYYQNFVIEYEGWKQSCAESTSVVFLALVQSLLCMAKFL